MALSTQVTMNTGTTGPYATVAGAPVQTAGYTMTGWIAMPFDAMQNVGNSTLDTGELYLFRVSNSLYPRMGFICRGKNGGAKPIFSMSVDCYGPDHDTGLDNVTTVNSWQTNGIHTALTWMFAAFAWNSVTGAATMYCSEFGGSLTTVATEPLATRAEFGIDMNQIDICAYTDIGTTTTSVFGVKTFSGVLSAAQIADEAASYAPVSTPWNWLPFETGASRLTDASGNGHNATQVGTLTDGIEAPLTSVVPVVAIPWFAFA